MTRILVAEDNLSLRLYLGINLVKCGYEVIEADDGQQTLDLIQDTPPDLLMLDLYLPKLNGFKVLETLAASDKPFFPVIVFSAQLDAHYEDLRKYPFITDLLRKPIGRDQIMGSVKQALS